LKNDRDTYSASHKFHVRNALPLTAVFFNLFVAAEPSAKVCVANGILCIDPSVYPTFCNKPNVQKWQFRSFSAEPLAVTRGTLRFRGTPVEKHCSTEMSI